MTDVSGHSGSPPSQRLAADSDVRAEPASGWRSSTLTGAVQALLRALEQPADDNLALVVDQRAQLNSQAAVQFLIEAGCQGDIRQRLKAIAVLERLGGQAIPYLADTLEDDDPDVRRLAVDALTALNDAGAVKPLCTALADTDRIVACSAAKALGQIGAKTALPALMEASRAGGGLALEAIEALCKIADSSVVDCLEEKLDDDDPRIVCQALGALGLLADTDKADRIRPLLDHEDTPTAQAALEALINIGARHGIDAVGNARLTRFAEFLTAGLKNGDVRITNLAVRRLSRQFEPEIAEIAVEYLEFLSSTAVRRFIRAFVKAGAPALDLALAKFAGCPVGTRLLLMDIIRHLLDKSTSHRLAEFADDPNPTIRQEIAATLGLVGSQEAVPVLRRMTIDRNSEVRASAFAALGWLGLEDQADFLFTGLEDNHQNVRQAAMGALVILSGPKVMAKFMADLYHHGPERRRLAVTALGLIGEDEAVDGVLKAVSHPDPWIRIAALKALARIREIPDVASVLAALGDENSSVRKAAVSVVIALLGNTAVPTVQPLLRDPDASVRTRVVDGIGTLGQPEFSKLIQACLEDEHEAVRIAAIRALWKLNNVKDKTLDGTK